jgi:type II secretory pathway pseudopilin PulG
MNHKAKQKFHVACAMLHDKGGFTIVEIMVATTLFAFTAIALTSLFNFTLRINRKAEVLRQATQGMRDFVELMAKEVRNGQIDYGVSDFGTIVDADFTPFSSPCPFPSSYGAGTALTHGDSLLGKSDVRSSYDPVENRLGIVDLNGDRWCFYLGDSSGNYVGQGINQGQVLVVQKNGSSPQIANPPNYKMDYLAFFIRPLCDPYIITCKDYGNGAPKIQPFVTIVAKFTTKLPTGEQVPIFYQTSISTDKYDVPNSP